MSVQGHRVNCARVLGKTSVAIMVAVALSACISRGMQQELTTCTFPDTTRTPAPSFICDQQIEGYPITRLTSAPSSADVETNVSIERARLEVQHTMALEWLVTWFDDVADDQKTEAKQVILTWLNEELRVVRTRESSSGTMWLLLGIAHSEVDTQVQLRNRFAAAGIKTTDR
ncbi:hypothetical protein [Saccharospirillum impatiens]|uniref:hypothetical protein n=1 Tax=Saccharospirillum impatiens TaxID=169438 RepID=UPI0012F97F8D|nr:hypothetical protein [Saccharospirillum impatiens]